MWTPNYGETEVSPYYQNETIQNAALPDGLSRAICDYVSSRFLISKDVDALLNGLAKEIAECINDGYIEEVNKRAFESLGFRLRELVRQTINQEIRKHIELMQKSYFGLIDEEFVKKVSGFLENNKNE